jgi:hypothetical protein
MNIEELREVFKDQLDNNEEFVYYSIQYQSPGQRGTDKFSLSISKHRSDQLELLLSKIDELMLDRTIDGRTPLFIKE